MNQFITVLFITIILYIIFILSIIYWLEYDILYYPKHNHIWSPSIPHKNLFIDINTSSEINPNILSHTSSYIHAWYFNNYPYSKTILFCHGNSSNISHREYIISLCNHLQLNLIIFDYEGYGLSSGIPNFRNLPKNGYAIYNYLSNSCSPNDIIIWGESLGGSVAIDIASRFNCSRLILMSTFSSLSDIILYRDIYCFQSHTFSFMFKHIITDIMSKNKIKSVNCPIIIIHSQSDTIIPFTCSTILYDNIHHSNKLLLSITGDHSSPSISHDQLYTLLSFCNINISNINNDIFIDNWLQNLPNFAKLNH